MAAYAALVSLMNLIEQLQHHPQPPITLHKEQVGSLTEKIAFLQHFLEAYNSYYSNQEVELLRSRIADAAYAVEDVIESHIVDQIHNHEKIYSTDLYQGLQKVIEDMDLVKQEVVGIKDKMGTQDQLQRSITSNVVLSKPPSTERKIMVGFDDVLNEMLDKLTREPHSLRQIIPISGMGGMGKTTLARNVYTNPLVEYHFHVLAWAAISQEYNIREILVEILLCQKDMWSRESLKKMSEVELREKLYKSLYGRRYLIIMDDVWSEEIWDKVKFVFPNDNNGSRIVITTRLSNVASCLASCCGIEMNFLDQDKSWSLLCKTVFGEEDCPPELEHVGMEIAQSCKGLPLSIVVLGGLLAKSKRTLEFWEYIAEDLNSVVNLEVNEQCLKILHTSYDQLPVHLKACFLYMGSFPEDYKIRVSELIKTWIAEGFLKPISGKSFEESAEDYLIDLIGRNLILVSDYGYSGKVKFCNIHDILRDLCLREARKERFLCVVNQHFLNTPYEGMNTQRRISVNQNSSEKEYFHSLESASITRSLVFYNQEELPLVELRLLRIFKRISNNIFPRDKRIYNLESIFQRVNLRYMAISYFSKNLIFPSSVSLLWSLQTFIVNKWASGLVAPLEIWKMPLLRHIKCNSITLPDPPSGHTDRRDDLVLQNLHTLSHVYNLKFGEEVIKRIPNVKKLRLEFNKGYEAASDYCLNNLSRLDKLESFAYTISTFDSPSRSDLLQNLAFPHSLKKLCLRETRLYWEDMSTKIGLLPFLEVLKLEYHSFIGSEWEAVETVEGQFCRLKYLLIRSCNDLEHWNAENVFFPCLEQLVLHGLPKLKEIPSGIGEIQTLKLMQLKYCSVSAMISAKEILEEQEDLGNESIQVTVILDKDKQDEVRDTSYLPQLGREDYQLLESLASDNFQVKILGRSQY